MYYLTYCFRYNLITKTIKKQVQHHTTYEYDYENRLVHVETPDHIADYEYDHDGIRVAKTVGGTRTNYLLDKQRPYAQILEEQDINGDLIASYTYGQSRISRHSPQGTTYYHSNYIGSVYGLTDANENVVAYYDYDSWGNKTGNIGQQAVSNPFRFAGEQLDEETGMYYLRARYYDPSVGRFVTKDSWGGSMRDPVSQNKYLYANGNPVMWNDPGGLMPVSAVGAGQIGSLVDTMAQVGLFAMLNTDLGGEGGGIEDVKYNAVNVNCDWTNCTGYALDWQNKETKKECAIQPAKNFSFKQMLGQIGVSLLKINSIEQWNHEARVGDVTLLFSKGDINTPLDRTKVANAKGVLKYNYSANWHTMKIIKDTQKFDQNKIRGWWTTSRWGAVERPGEAPVGEIIQAAWGLWDEVIVPDAFPVPAYPKWEFFLYGNSLYILR